MASVKYRALADAVTYFHFLWTFLVFGGGILVVFYHHYAIFQIGVLTLTLLANLPFKNKCPLTLLEGKLRRELDPAYDNQKSFTTTYLNKIFKTYLKPQEVSVAIAIFYIISYSLSIFALMH